MNEKTKSFLSGGLIGVLTKNPENKTQKRSGFALASLILGVFSVILGWFPLFGWIFIVLAIVFAILALVNINKGLSSGRSLAIAGFILGAIGLLIAIISMIAFVKSAENGSSCTDMSCFITKANQCQAITYEETTEIGTINYIITSQNSNCILTKEIVELSESEDAFLKKTLEGKKMECTYSSGQFNGQWTISLIEGLEDCQGELKEALGQLLLLV